MIGKLQPDIRLESNLRIQQVAAIKGETRNFFKKNEEDDENRDRLTEE